MVKFKPEFKLHANTTRKTVVCHSLINLLPRSCVCPRFLEKEMGPWEVEPIIKALAGTVKRVFKCHMYHLQVFLVFDFPETTECLYITYFSTYQVDFDFV